MLFKLFGKIIRIKLPWEKEPTTTSTRTLDWLKGDISYAIDGIVNGMEEMRKKTAKLTREMWMTQTDRDWLLNKLKPAIPDPDYVSPMYGVKVYVSDLIPPNIVKVVANDGSVSFIQLREGDDESKSREV